MPAMAVVPHLTIEQQRENITGNFTRTNDGVFKSPDPKMAEYYSKLVNSQQRVSSIWAIGEQSATIINLNPYDLVVNNPLFDGLKVKACQDGRPYSAFVIRDVKYQTNTGLDNNWSPEEFWPIQLAQEFERQYQEKGGVFIISGNLEKNPELANTADFIAKKSEAMEALFRHAFSMKQEGDKLWLDPNKKSTILSTHRQMAALLFNAKKIARLPDWIDLMVSTEEIIAGCPSCGTEPKKGASQCAVCAFTLDPAAAFRLGTIPETHQSLERLTRAQVKELGVSAYVAETVDELPKRLEAGLAKPLSLFEHNQIVARDQEIAKAEADTAKVAKKAEGKG
jgi:hypothetical protein